MLYDLGQVGEIIKMGSKWSTYLQPIELLKSSRQAILDKTYVNIVSKLCGIESGGKYLDAGCGIGSFSKYLSLAVKECDFYGLDEDEQYLKYGEDMYNDNKIRYIQGSIYDIPLSDNQVDATYSLTLFNCLDNPINAIKEMRRVTKKGGSITAVVTTGLGHAGSYKIINERTWYQNLKKYRTKVIKFTEECNIGISRMNCGIDYKLLPRLFYSCNLHNVSIFSVPYTFSLDDIKYTKEEKEKYLNNLYLGEIKKIDALSQLDKFNNYFSQQELNEYKKMLLNEKEYNLDKINSGEWEWEAGVMLGVKGYN